VNIRPKIVLVVLPLLIAPLVLTAVFSVTSARAGITAVATSFLQFKAEQLRSYAEGQWNLLAANGLENDPAYVEASQAALETFARGLVRSRTERIFAFSAEGTLAMKSGEIAAEPGEAEALAALARSGTTGWQTFRLGGADRVAHALAFEPFRWTLFVSEESAAFYGATNRILEQTGWILGVSLAVSVLLLLLFAGYLTRPLRQVVDAMTAIISTGDLSRRVDVLYRDETGRLGHSFNLMTSELEKAYGEIKGYALRAAVSQMKEQKIRHIFQKYVPRSVIEQFFANPEKMLVGENRVLAVLFSDIRSFTTISERMRPEDLVDSLNRYFSRMVDVVMNRGGIVDKYIGDAVMAFFGAPVHHDDDALQSVLSALDMLESLADFNRWQEDKGRQPFRIGVGINYGPVTVGNIGSERKMDYTVIGDMVNLASRLEGLTKKYPGEALLVSDSVHDEVKTSVPCRLLDRVAVKGRRTGSAIYGARRTLSPTEEKAWKVHGEGVALFYERRFDEASARFRAVLDLLPGDPNAARFLERCAAFRAAPPPADWDGVVEMKEK